MSLKCGIVGLPNVGKSTLFNCLSNAKAQAANFPFCTIEPNLGTISVPDERLNTLADLVHPEDSPCHSRDSRYSRFGERSEQRGRLGKQIPCQHKGM